MKNLFEEWAMAQHYIDLSTVASMPTENQYAESVTWKMYQSFCAGINLNIVEDGVEIDDDAVIDRLTEQLEIATKLLHDAHALGFFVPQYGSSSNYDDLCKRYNSFVENEDD